MPRPRFSTPAAQRGKPEREARATIASGLDWGVERPRATSQSSAGRSVGRDKRTHDRAIDLWAAASDTGGTIADRYLESLGLGSGTSHGLRHAERVRMPIGGEHPCILAAVVEPLTGKLLAVQRTALKADGTDKAEIDPAKASLGRTSGGAIVFGDLTVDGPIVEGEGLETVLSVVEATGLAGIATLRCRHSREAGVAGRPARHPVGRSRQ